jgi:hypothetical protein
MSGKQKIIECSESGKLAGLLGKITLGYGAKSDSEHGHGNHIAGEIKIIND